MLPVSGCEEVVQRASPDPNAVSTLAVAVVDGCCEFAVVREGLQQLDELAMEPLGEV